MYIHLYRNQPQGSAITGRLVIDGRWFCNTLERVGYQIPALCYHVAVTHSPKFKRLLPLVCGVPQSRSLGVQEFRSSGVLISAGLERVFAGANGQEVRSSGVTSEQAQSATEHLNSSSAASEHLNSKASEPRSPLRSGIRFHRGTKPQHSTGCILLPNRETEDKLTNLLKNTQDHEEIILDVTDFRPGTPRGYNTPCPPELQKP